MDINVTVRDMQYLGLPREEDRAGFDPDAQVIRMCNENHLNAAVLEDSKPAACCWEQLPKVPEQYRQTEAQISGAMLVRILAAVPALTLAHVDWIPGWLGLLIALGCGAWAVAYGLRAREA